MLITLVTTFPQLGSSTHGKGGNIKMHKGSISSITLALVTAQLLSDGLVIFQVSTMVRRP